MDETSYISCACNRVPNSADWGGNGLVCYGACNAIALYDPSYGEIGRVTHTLHKHTARVNVVRWIKRNDRKPETELLSASTDGTAIIWSAEGKTYVPTSIANDGNPLTIADAVYLQESSLETNYPELLLCTASTEGIFVLWHREADTQSLSKIQTLTFGRRIPTEARLSFLPDSKTPLVAIAVDDCTIHIYCQDLSHDEKIQFVQAQTLQNHEDWIRCMDFTHDSENNCFLATGSQDSTIRLWKIYVDHEDVALEVKDVTQKTIERCTKKDETQRRIKRFTVGNETYAITLESILSGHEHWVYGVNWHPPVFSTSDNKLLRPITLLSCAMDKSMIIWEPDTKHGGVWREAVRVGEVGGNSLGFYGCKYSPDGLSILAHSYQGSFHLWKYQEKEHEWVPRVGPTGHFSGVVDLCWDHKGRFLVSASLDQTTRVHAPWKTNEGDAWHEISRPQVHGYDLSCLAMLGPYTFASGAEEKVVRVFTAPATFQKYLSMIANTDDWEGQLTEGASVPALGLTNKALFDDGAGNDNRMSDLDYKRLPTEEELIRHTLWPELQKLYGHGYEIFSIASRRDGTRFATACKSATADHAPIIIWCTKTWSQVQKIASHRLTVTQMAFSPDDSHLVSVSRDRRWSLCRVDEKGDYEIVAESSKTGALHARIIWCCAWTHDSKYFATGSRDGKIGIWSIEPIVLETGKPSASLEIKDSSITAIAFAPCAYSHDSYVIALGHDDGRIEVRKIVFNNDNVDWRIYAQYDTLKAHHSTVKKLAFRPTDGAVSKETKIVQLASCGMDDTLKIHDICIADLEAL